MHGLVFQGTRHKVTYDGMMHYLEIPKTRETDVGAVRIVARNSEGEAEVSTSLAVQPHDDWRSQLRQAPKGRGQLDFIYQLSRYMYCGIFLSRERYGYCFVSKILFTKVSRITKLLRKHRTLLPFF